MLFWMLCGSACVRACLWYSCPWESRNKACVCRMELCLYTAYEITHRMFSTNKPDDRATNRLIMDWFSSWLTRLVKWVTVSVNQLTSRFNFCELTDQSSEQLIECLCMLKTWTCSVSCRCSLLNSCEAQGVSSPYAQQPTTVRCCTMFP